MNNGWIKIHRQVKDNAFCYGNAERLGFWVQILLMANREEREFYIGSQRVTCKEGQIVTGRDKLSEETGLHPSKIERHLEILEKEGMIEQQTNSKFRIVIIKNWAKYQVTEQQLNNKRTTDEQQMNTNKKEEKYKKEENITIQSAGAAAPEIISGTEMELRKLIEWINTKHIFPNSKIFTQSALKKWIARRKTFSAQEIENAFANLPNEPDQWQMKNNGFREMSWWLASDDRIRTMQNLHLKISKNRAVFIS